MSWWTYKKSTNEKVRKTAISFIWDCPASIKKGTSYMPVSMRKASFRERGIIKGDLTRVLTRIKRLIPRDMYIPLRAEDSVPKRTESLLRTCPYQDAEVDLIVFITRYEMSDAEAIFYYIRNAFAHGAFEAKNVDGSLVYYFESSKEGVVKARLRLKESTMEELQKIMHMTLDEIRGR